MRPRVRQRDDQELAEQLAAAPTIQRPDIWRRMASYPYTAEEIEQKLEGPCDSVRRMEASLQYRPWLIGEIFTLANTNMTPYVWRVVDRDRPSIDSNPRMTGWWERIGARPASPCPTSPPRRSPGRPPYVRPAIGRADEIRHPSGRNERAGPQRGGALVRRGARLFLRKASSSRQHRQPGGLPS